MCNSHSCTLKFQSNPHPPLPRKIMLKMPGNVRIEEQGDSWFLVWDPVPDAESYHFSQPAPYVTKMTSVNINTCKGSTSDHLLITFCGVTARGEIGEAFTGFMALPEEKKVAIVVTKKQWNLWVWLAKFKPSLPKFKNPFKPLPSFPSFKLPSVKIDWSRFKWKQRGHQARPSRVASMFRFKLPSFKVSPKTKAEIKAELKRLFIKRTHQTNRKKRLQRAF